MHFSVFNPLWGLKSKMASLVKGLSRLPNKHIFIRSIGSSTTKEILGEGANVDTPTHTGQEWDKDDYRRVRFIGKDKLVNTNFAIDLIADDPIVVCERRRVASNSGGALGHPKVFINLDKPEVGVCGYSGRKFIQKKFYKEAEHGPSITYEEYIAEMKALK